MSKKRRAGKNFQALSRAFNAGAANGTINGTTVIPGLAVNFDKSGQNGTASLNLVDPIVVDASSTTFTVITY
jgi:hypothetical protein